MAMSIDPVCGMTVDEAEADGLKDTFRGHEYYFCSEECIHRFQSDPEAYVDQAA